MAVYEVFLIPLLPCYDREMLIWIFEGVMGYTRNYICRKTLFELNEASTWVSILSLTWISRNKRNITGKIHDWKMGSLKHWSWMMFQFGRVSKEWSGILHIPYVFLSWIFDATPSVFAVTRRNDSWDNCVFQCLLFELSFHMSMQFYLHQSTKHYSERIISHPRTWLSYGECSCIML